MDLLSFYNKVSAAFNDVHNLSLQKKIIEEIDSLEDSPKKNILLGVILAYKGNIDDAYALILESSNSVSDFIAVEILERIKYFQKIIADTNLFIQDGSSENAILMFKEAIFHVDSFPLCQLQFCESLIRLTQQQQRNIEEEEEEEEEDGEEDKKCQSENNINIELDFLQFCDIGLLIDPSNRFLLKSSSKIKEKLGRYDESLEDLKKILNTTTNDDSIKKKVIEREINRISKIIQEKKENQKSSSLSSFVTGESSSSFKFPKFSTNNFETNFETTQFNDQVQTNEEEESSINNLPLPSFLSSSSDMTNPFSFEPIKKIEDSNQKDKAGFSFDFDFPPPSNENFSPTVERRNNMKKERSKWWPSIDDDDYVIHKEEPFIFVPGIVENDNITQSSSSSSGNNIHYFPEQEQQQEQQEQEQEEQQQEVETREIYFHPNRTIIHGSGVKKTTTFRREFINKPQQEEEDDDIRRRRGCIINDLGLGDLGDEDIPLNVLEMEEVRANFYSWPKKRLLFLALERSLGIEYVKENLISEKNLLDSCDDRCVGCVSCQDYIKWNWEEIVMRDGLENLVLKELKKIIVSSSFINISMTPSSFMECLEYRVQKKRLSATKSYHKRKKIPFFGKYIIYHDFGNGFCLIYERVIEEQESGANLRKPLSLLEYEIENDCVIDGRINIIKRLENENIVRLMYNGERVMSFHLYLTNHQHLKLNENIICPSPFLQKNSYFGNGMPIKLCFLGNGFFVLDGILCHHKTLRLFDEQFSEGEILPTTFPGEFLSFGEKLVFFEQSRFKGTGSKFHLIAQWIHYMGYSNQLIGLKKVFENKRRGNISFGMVKNMRDDKGFGSFSKEYQQWIIFMLWLNCQEGCLFSKIPKDVLLFEIIPFMSEYYVFVNTYRFIKSFFHVMMMDRANNKKHLLSFEFVRDYLKEKQKTNMALLIENQEFLKINELLSFQVNNVLKISRMNKNRTSRLLEAFGLRFISDNMNKEEEKEECEGEEEEEEIEKKKKNITKNNYLDDFHLIVSSEPFIIKKLFEITLRKVYNHNYLKQNRFSFSNYFNNCSEEERFNENIYVHKRIFDQCIKLFEKIENMDKRGVISDIGGEELFMLNQICDEKKGIRNYDLLLIDMLERRIEYYFKKYHQRKEMNKKNIKYICEVFNLILSSEERYLFYQRFEIIKTFLKNCYDPVTGDRIMNSFTSSNIMRVLKKEYEKPVCGGQIKEFFVKFITGPAFKFCLKFQDFINFFSSSFIESDFRKSNSQWLMILCDFSTVDDWIEKSIEMIFNIFDELSSGKHTSYRVVVLKSFLKLSKKIEHFETTRQKLELWIPQFVETFKNLSYEVDLNSRGFAAFLLLKTMNYLIEKHLVHVEEKVDYIYSLVFPLFNSCDLSKFSFVDVMTSLEPIDTLCQEELFKLYFSALKHSKDDRPGHNSFSVITTDVRIECTVILSQLMNIHRKEVETKNIDFFESVLYYWEEKKDILHFLVSISILTQTIGSLVTRVNNEVDDYVVDDIVNYSEAFKKFCILQKPEKSENIRLLFSAVISSEWIRDITKTVFKNELEVKFCFEKELSSSSSTLTTIDLLEDIQLLFLFNDIFEVMYKLFKGKEIISLMKEHPVVVVDYICEGILSIQTIDRISKMGEYLVSILKHVKYTSDCKKKKEKEEEEDIISCFFLLYSIYMKLVCSISSLFLAIRSGKSEICELLKKRLSGVRFCNQKILKTILDLEYIIDDPSYQYISQARNGLKREPIEIMKPTVPLISIYSHDDKDMNIINEFISFFSKKKIEEIEVIDMIPLSLLLNIKTEENESIIKFLSSQVLTEIIFKVSATNIIGRLFSRWTNYIDRIETFKILRLIFSECTDPQFTDILRICFTEITDERFEKLDEADDDILGKGCMIKFFENFLYSEEFHQPGLDLFYMIFKRATDEKKKINDILCAQEIIIGTLLHKNCKILNYLSKKQFVDLAKKYKPHSFLMMKDAKKREGEEYLEELKKKRNEIFEFILKYGDIFSINQKSLIISKKLFSDQPTEMAFGNLPFFLFIMVLEPVLYSILMEREGVDLVFFMRIEDVMANVRKDFHSFLRTILGEKYSNHFSDESGSFVPLTDSERRKRKKKKKR